jgi:hypothetical protein
MARTIMVVLVLFMHLVALAAAGQSGLNFVASSSLTGDIGTSTNPNFVFSYPSKFSDRILARIISPVANTM